MHRTSVCRRQEMCALLGSVHMCKVVIATLGTKIGTGLEPILGTLFQQEILWNTAAGSQYLRFWGCRRELSFGTYTGSGCHHSQGTDARVGRSGAISSSRAPQLPVFSDAPSILNINFLLVCSIGFPGGGVSLDEL